MLPGTRCSCAAGTPPPGGPPSGLGLWIAGVDALDGDFGALAAVGRRVNGHRCGDGAGGRLLPELAAGGRSRRRDRPATTRLPLRLRTVILTMPLSMVQESPLSVRVTGWLTVTFATFGACANAANGSTPPRARIVERTKSLVWVMTRPFRRCLAFTWGRARRKISFRDGQKMAGGRFGCLIFNHQQSRR